MSATSTRMRIVSQEAAYWYIRCVDEPVMPFRDRLLFVAWLKRSPENVAEILHVAEMDGQFAGQWLRDRVGELEESNVIDIGLDSNASQYDYQPSDTVSDTIENKNVENKKVVRLSRETQPSAKKNAKCWPMWAAAATVAAFALTLLLGFVFLGVESGEVVATVAAQWQRKTLEDGSVVHLDARTRLRIEFTEKQRIIHLEQGWAVFDVAKDHERPFTVKAGSVDVTAVGTRFGVSIDNGVTTTVSEGTVQVTERGRQNGSAVFLHKGQELHVRAGHTMMLTDGDIVEVNAERKLMWVTGRVEMNHATIGEIVHQFNRRHAIQAEIVDPRISGRVVDLAIMRVDNVDDFIEVMKSEGVAVSRDGSTLTLRAQSE